MIDVRIDIDRSQIKSLEKRLGNLKSKAPTVLARAINRAAAKARTEMWDTMKSRYFVSQKGVYGTISVHKANSSKLSAEVTSKGAPILLTEFKTGSLKRAKRKKKGGYTPDVFKAGVKKAGGVKPLSGNPKPFGTGKNGSLVVRESSKRWPVHPLYGPAVPSMIKNEEVIGRVKEAAMDMLERRIDAEVNNILQRGR